MNTASSSRRRCKTLGLQALLAATLSLVAAPLILAQQPDQLAAEATPFLPDAPSVTAGDLPSGQSVLATKAPVMASPRAKFIFPDQTAPPLTGTEKFQLGLLHSISLYSVTGWLASAEYAQIINGTPNYGTNLGAFGQRFGATALRGSTEEIIGTSILAPLLHEDPRFYRMGPRRNVVARTAYAVTRVVVTRSDSGSLTPNLSLLGGNVVGSALTNAYYPDQNRGFNQTMKTFGGSLGGAAFGFFVDEFLRDKLLSRTMLDVHLGRQGH